MIPQSASTSLDGTAECEPNRSCQPRRFRRGDRITRSGRVKPCPVKCFVGVDVPNASEHGLIKQGSLHSPPGPPQKATKAPSLDRGSLWSKTRQKAALAVLGGGEQVHTAKPPWIDKRHSDLRFWSIRRLDHPDQVPVRKHRLPRRAIFKVDSSRHSQSDDHPTAIGKRDHQLFSSSVDITNDPTSTEIIRGKTPLTTTQTIPDDIPSLDFGHANQATGHDTSDLSANRFDFWEFRHGLSGSWTSSQVPTRGLFIRKSEYQNHGRGRLYSGVQNHSVVGMVPGPLPTPSIAAHDTETR